MKRSLACSLGLAGLVASVVLAGSPVVAATPEAPTWIVTAPRVSYEGGPPQIVSHQSGDWGARTVVYMYAPGGGSGVHDLEISVRSAEPAAAIGVNLAKMPEILALEAFADAWTTDDGVLAKSAASMLDGSLLIERPDPCSITSLNSSEFEVSLLGVSGTQYNALVEVDFGGRLASCDDKDSKPDEIDEGFFGFVGEKESAPESTASAAPEQSADPTPSASPVAAPEEEVAKVAQEPAADTGSLGVIALIAAAPAAMLALWAVAAAQGSLARRSIISKIQRFAARA